MRISPDVLEDVCKRMIEVILFCLPDATRGTIYTVGSIPDLQVIRVASGDKRDETDQITWDVKNRSDYDPPGKLWEDYRDRPGGILEAMSWCVAKQKSWTADDPENNIRSVRKQLEGKAGEDYHHMEPVLVRKSDLWDILPSLGSYPTDHLGEPVWQETSFATVAVIKIHFAPGSIRRGDKATQVIKKLSKSLGTQMLSLHAKELALEKQKRLAEERQDTCNTFAHEFRNILTRTGFIYRAINNEISYLREYWEGLVHQYNPEIFNKKKILEELIQLSRTVQEVNGFREVSRLINYQEQLKASSLLPKQGTLWLQRKIRPLWESILSKDEVDAALKRQVEGHLESLEESFYLGLDRSLIDKIDGLSDELKEKWTDLVYKEIDGRTNGTLKNYIDLLDNTKLEIPHKRQTLKNFVYFKGLIELLPDIENKVNDSLELLKNGDMS
jgi:hypothetical protein